MVLLGFIVVRLDEVFKMVVASCGCLLLVVIVHDGDYCIFVCFYSV